MRVPHAEITRAAWMLFTIALVAGCATPGEQRNYLTVPEVSQRAASLAGKQVRVRGFGFVEHAQTLVLCEPARCDCNDTWATLVLLGEELKPEDYSRFFSLPRITISESALQCRGDECTMRCTPFDPSVAKEFELVGTLAIDHDNLYLKDLDLEASCQRIDDQWIPIETGEFTVSR